MRREVPVAEYIAGVARECDVRSLGGNTLGTLYFGGGTPSKLGGSGVAELIGVVRSRFQMAPNAEVTLETNPEDVTPDAARAWRDAGVNRLSLGSQSFDDRVLEWMHRTHTADDISRSVRVARDAGLDNVSLDLIFALPESLGRDWRKDLDLAVALEPDHVSVYGLTVEHATPLGRWTARGEVREAPEERWAFEFESAHNVLASAGYGHYEVSNYARTGRRAEHNSAYWSDHAFMGVGPAAHGFDGSARRWNEREYARWQSRIGAGEDPIGGSETLTEGERTAERVYLGLRTDRGLDIAESEAVFVAPWVDAGWAEITQRHDSRTLVLTNAGWMRLDSLAAALTAFRSRY